MTDYYLGVVPQSIEWELRGNVSRFQSPMGGVTRTLERVGARWAATWRWDAVAGENAARLKSFLATQRGGGNRFWAYDPGYTMRGAYSAAELLTNPEFASGTTSWGVNTTAAALTAADRVLRVTQTGPATNPQARQTTTAVQYAPYAGRLVAVHGRGATSADYRAHFNDGISANDSAITGSGYLVAARVALATALDFAGYKAITSSGLAGNYFELPFTSASRCALVDNGPNLLLRSDEFDNAAWTKFGTTVTANYWGSPPGPDGTTSADAVVEDTSAGQHYVLQEVTRVNAAAEWSFAVALHAGDVGGLRNRAQIRVLDGAATSGGKAMFDLAAGTISTAASAVGTATNARAFIAPLGNGWYYCCVVVRLPATDTAVKAVIDMIENPATESYTGASSRNLGVWRATLAQSSVPTRLRQTTTALTAGTPQTGAALYLKGLPASANGLLLAGDWSEIITPTYSELKRVAAPLNSDAACLGYLQFEPILRQSPADNAAVIIAKPMGRFMLDESTVKWSQGRAGVYSLSFRAVEDIAA